MRAVPRGNSQCSEWVLAFFRPSLRPRGAYPGHGVQSRAETRHQGPWTGADNPQVKVEPAAPQPARLPEPDNDGVLASHSSGGAMGDTRSTPWTSRSPLSPPAPLLPDAAASARGSPGRHANSRPACRTH
ncbi:MAG: hypothetical protein ACK5QX_09225 [bacterium]